MRWFVVAVLAAGCSFRPAIGGDAPAAVPDAGDVRDASATTEPPESLACLTDPTYQPVAGSAHTYKLIAQTSDFDTAFDACAADGAHLVAIHDAAENQLVFDNAKDAWIGQIGRAHL